MRQQSADVVLTFAPEPLGIKNLASGLLVPSEPVGRQVVISRGSRWCQLVRDNA